MTDTFGFGTDTTGFSSTVHDAIQKAVIDTLRAGLVSLPKGAVVPSTIVAQSGENFTMRVTEYPDLVDAAAGSLSEGVAPSPVKLGIDTQDYTVAQKGAWTKVTDIAQLQSPHPLGVIAKDKIARLAAQTIDGLGLTALLAHASDNVTSDILGTANLLDAAAILAGRNVMPIPGVGFYAVCHPYALRGLTGEPGLDGYVNVTAQAKAGELTAGAVGQYRGITFLTSSRIKTTTTDVDGNYPVFFLGRGSVAFGDVSSISYHGSSASAPGNELQQLAWVGFKGILGGAVLSFAETADGAGTNGSTTDRVYRIDVQSGVSV